MQLFPVNRSNGHSSRTSHHRGHSYQAQWRGHHSHPSQHNKMAAPDEVAPSPIRINFLQPALENHFRDSTEFLPDTALTPEAVKAAVEARRHKALSDYRIANQFVRDALGDDPPEKIWRPMTSTSVALAALEPTPEGSKVVVYTPEAAVNVASAITHIVSYKLAQIQLLERDAYVEYVIEKIRPFAQKVFHHDMATLNGFMSRVERGLRALPEEIFQDDLQRASNAFPNPLRKSTEMMYKRYLQFIDDEIVLTSILQDWKHKTENGNEEWSAPHQRSALHHLFPGYACDVAYAAVRKTLTSLQLASQQLERPLENHEVTAIMVRVITPCRTAVAKTLPHNDYCAFADRVENGLLNAGFPVNLERLCREQS